MSFRRSICLIFLLLCFLCFPATAYAGRLVPGAKHGATGCGQSFCGIQDHAGSSHPARINPPLRALGDLCVSTAFPTLNLKPSNGSVPARAGIDAPAPGTKKAGSIGPRRDRETQAVAACSSNRIAWRSSWRISAMAWRASSNWTEARSAYSARSALAFSVYWALMVSQRSLT